MGSREADILTWKDTPDTPAWASELLEELGGDTTSIGVAHQQAEVLHDVAGCALLACELCDAYGSGWAAGKDKLAFEVEAVKDNAHGAGCGCQPCALVRLVLGGCWCHIHERGSSR